MGLTGKVKATCEKAVGSECKLNEEPEEPSQVGRNGRESTVTNNYGQDRGKLKEKRQCAE